MTSYQLKTMHRMVGCFCNMYRGIFVQKTLEWSIMNVLLTMNLVYVVNYHHFKATGLFIFALCDRL